MARRGYAGGAVPTTLSSSMSVASGTAQVTSLSGWPSGAFPFFAVINKDDPNEEKVLCTSVNGFDLTVLRGQDGTTARDHSSGSPFEHCFTATDADEANGHVNSSDGVHGVPVGGKIVGTTSTQTLTNKTLNFAPETGNVAQNIPLSAMPEVDAELAGLQNAIVQEAQDRATQDNNIVAAYTAADQAITQAYQAADTAETNARVAADNLRYTKTETDAAIAAAVQAYALARIPFWGRLGRSTDVPLTAGAGNYAISWESIVNAVTQADAWKPFAAGAYTPPGLVAPVAGIYTVTIEAQMSLNAAGSGRSRVALMKNGVEVSGSVSLVTNTSGNTAALNVTAEIPAQVGDVLSAHVAAYGTIAQTLSNAFLVVAGPFGRAGA